MIDEFRDAMRSAGLEPPEVIKADGKLRRFASNGKRGDGAGWYVLHGDGIPAGSFGDWRTGISETWRANIGRSLTPTEEAAHRAKVEGMRREREPAETRCKAEAATNAGAIWRKSRFKKFYFKRLSESDIAAYGLSDNGDSLPDDGGEESPEEFPK